MENDIQITGVYSKQRRAEETVFAVHILSSFTGGGASASYFHGLLFIPCELGYMCVCVCNSHSLFYRPYGENVNE